MDIIKEYTATIREEIVQGMYDMATVKWTPSSQFHEILQATITGSRKPYTIYEVGKVYYGLPFTKRKKSSVEDFLHSVENTILAVPQEYINVLGVDCTASMIFPLRKYMDMPIRYLTSDFLVDRNITTPVGLISVEENQRNSQEIQKKFLPCEFYESYALLDIGDIVCSHYVKTDGKMVDHTRLLSGTVHTVRDDKGVINPIESYLIITENTANLADMSDKNNYGGLINENDYIVPYCPNLSHTDIKVLQELAGKNTNFRVNRKINFEQLYKTNYIPLTFNCYHNNLR